MKLSDAQIEAITQWWDKLLRDYNYHEMTRKKLSEDAWVNLLINLDTFINDLRLELKALTFENNEIFVKVGVNYFLPRQTILANLFQNIAISKHNITMHYFPFEAMMRIQVDGQIIVQKGVNYHKEKLVIKDLPSQLIQTSYDNAGDELQYYGNIPTPFIYSHLPKSDPGITYDAPALPSHTVKQHLTPDPLLNALEQTIIAENNKNTEAKENIEKVSKRRIEITELKTVDIKSENDAHKRKMLKLTRNFLWKSPKPKQTNQNQETKEYKNILPLIPHYK